MHKSRNKIYVFTPWTTSQCIPWFPVDDSVKNDMEGPWRKGGLFRQGNRFCRYIHPHPSKEYSMSVLLANYINKKNIENGFSISVQHQCHVTMINTGTDNHFFNLIKPHFKDENSVTLNHQGYTTQVMDKLSFLGVGFLWKEAVMRKLQAVVRLQHYNVPNLVERTRFNDNNNEDDRSKRLRGNELQVQPCQRSRDQNLAKIGPISYYSHPNELVRQNSRQVEPGMRIVEGNSQSSEVPFPVPRTWSDYEENINQRSRRESYKRSITETQSDDYELFPQKFN